MAEWKLSDATQIRKNLTKEQEDEISKLYRRVYLKARKEANSIPKDGTVSQKLRKQYLNQLKKQLDAAYKSLGEGLQKEIEKQAKKSAESVVDSTVSLLKNAKISIRGAYSHVPTEIVNAIATGQVYGGKWNLSSAIWSGIDKNQSDINRVIAEGVAANKSAYDIAKDLETYVNPSVRKDWNWSKVYPGTNKVVDYNAQRLARTMVSHAYQQSLERVCKNNPFVTGYIWQASNSARVCPICADRDGQFYRKGELPLDHPNGMCTFTAKIQGSMKDVSNRLADWVQGKEDSELDNWFSDMTGKSMEPTFNKNQEKWLTPLGYSPKNMPKDFTELAHRLSFSQQTEFLEAAGGTWSVPHPYQMMENWYKQNLASVRAGIGQISNKVTDFDGADWVRQLNTQNISKIRALQEVQQAPLSEKEIKALRTYTGSSYRWMNGYLRSAKKGVYKTGVYNGYDVDSDRLEELKACVEGMNKVTLKENLFLRRGTDLGDLAGFMPGDFNTNRDSLEGLSVAKLKEKFVGTVGEYKGFTSTSSLYDRGFNGDVEVIFKGSSSTKGASIMNISRFDEGEGETLLAAGTRVRVIDIQESDGHMGSSIRVFMEIMD